MSYLFGGLMIAAGLLIHLYVSVWAFFLPFIKAEHPLRSFFPNRAVLVAGPLLLAAIGFAGVALLVTTKTTKKTAKPKSK